MTDADKKEEEKDTTLVDDWLRRIKNHPVAAVIILIAIVLAAVSTVTGDLQKVIDLFRDDAARPFLLPKASTGIASFAVDYKRGPPPLRARFVRHDTSTTGDRTWDFGDGVTKESASQVVWHTYERPGVYSVRHLVRLPSQDEPIVCFQQNVLIVDYRLEARFRADRTFAVSATTITFEDTSIGERLTRHWDFGDGTTKRAEARTVQHHFASPGEYRVVLRVDRDPIIAGDPRLVDAVDHTITIAERAQAKFDPQPARGPGPLLVSFRNASIGDEFEWNFGDGSASESARAPTHRYENHGTFTATLTVRGKGTGNTDVARHQILVLPAGKAAFRVNKTVGDAPLTVKFTDASTGAKSYLWSFDRTNNVARERNPEHVYRQPGVYTVVLQIETETGPDRCEYPDLIRVLRPARASIRAMRTRLPRNDLVDFRCSVGGDIRFARLHFGDGQSQILPVGTHTARHQYSVVGARTASLIVMGQSGKSKTATQQVVVTPRQHRLTIQNWRTPRLFPRLWRGDSEFKGHGPRMSSFAAVSVSADRRSITMAVTYVAAETKRNWSTAQAAWNNLLVYAAPRGWRIKTPHPGRVLSANDTLTSSAKGVIERRASNWGTFYLRGDRSGKDIGVWTSIEVRLHRLDVTIEEDL